MKKSFLICFLLIASLSFANILQTEVYQFSRNNVEITREIDSRNGSIASIFKATYRFPKDAVIYDLFLPSKYYSSEIKANILEVFYFPEDIGKIDFLKDLAILILYDNEFTEIVEDGVEIKIASYLESDADFQMHENKYFPYRLNFLYVLAAIIFLIIACLLILLIFIFYFKKGKQTEKAFDPDSIMQINNKLTLLSLADEAISLSKNLDFSISLQENSKKLYKYFTKLLQEENINEEQFEINKQILTNLYFSLIEKDKNLAFDLAKRMNL